MPEQQELYKDDPDVTEQLRELERELAVRKECYPRWIEQDRIKLQTANYRIACLKAAIETIRNRTGEG